MYVSRRAGQGYRIRGSIVVALFLYCSFHTPSRDHRAALIAAQEKDARPTATIKVTLHRHGDLGVEVESMKGYLAEPERFLTADKELTAELAESYGSLSLTLQERQKRRTKRRAPWKSGKTHSRHTTFVDFFSQLCMAHLILAIPVPQIQEQIFAGRGVHFSK